MDEQFSNRAVRRRVLAVVLVMGLAAAPAFAQQSESEQGKLQGGLDARGQAVWILSGLLLGPIGLILPWVINPRVPGANLIGKSVEYVAGYVEGYRHEARPKNFFYSLAGFAVWGVAVTVLAVSAARSAEATSTACGESCGNGCSDAFGNWTSDACSSGCSPQLTVGPSLAYPLR
jgi:hypothetical protein